MLAYRAYRAYANAVEQLAATKRRQQKLNENKFNDKLFIQHMFWPIIYFLLPSTMSAPSNRHLL